MGQTLGYGSEGAAVAAQRAAVGEYTTVAKWFHWITVVLLAVALTLGFVVKYLKDDAKPIFFAIHESAGLTVLFVAIARLAWRFAHPPPPLPPQIPGWMHGASLTVHLLLYATLIAQPIVGFVMSQAYGFPMQGVTAYLGLIDLPKIMEKDVPLGQTLSFVHRVIGLGIVGLLTLHIGGAIVHQAIRRDGTLLRMV